MKAVKVLIPGKFVVIHSGHIRLFRLARELGNKTIVALEIANLEANEINWRKNALLSIDYIDEVLTYRKDLSEIILREKPEFVLKGSEFSNIDNPEQIDLNSYGGKIIFSSGSSFFYQEDVLNQNTNEFQVNISLEVRKYLERNHIDQDTVIKTLSKFNSIRTCVVGDLIVDEIINCHPIGMSQEDPMLVVTPVDSSKFVGGAGIVAAHCAKLGSDTTLITITGRDSIASWGLENLSNSMVKIINFEDENRPTTLKQKFKSGKQMLFKINTFNKVTINSELENGILKYFENNIDNFDLLILSDFSYGTISDNLARELISVAKKANIFVAADSQTSSQLGSLAKFKGVNLVTPTEVEARTEMKDEKSGLVVLAENLRNQLNAINILLKLGPDGVLLQGHEKNNIAFKTDQVPALNKAPIDTSGAGDSMLASASLALAAGETLYIAAFIGSVMAGLQVSRIGNIPISQDAIRNSLLM